MSLHVLEVCFIAWIHQGAFNLFFMHSSQEIIPRTVKKRMGDFQSQQSN
jgi:hypothetical protein